MIDGFKPVVIAKMKSIKQMRSQLFGWICSAVFLMIVCPVIAGGQTMVTTFPQNEYSSDKDSVYLEYVVNFATTGEFGVSELVSPTLIFNANKGLRYAVSFDGGPDQIVNIYQQYSPREMERWQANRINQTATRHWIALPGLHRLRIRTLEPGIVLQKILIDTGGLKPGFLGVLQSKQMRMQI